MLLGIDVITLARFVIYTGARYITIIENDYALILIAYSPKSDRIMRANIKSINRVRLLPRIAIMIPVEVDNREHLRAIDRDF